MNNPDMKETAAGQGVAAACCVPPNSRLHPNVVGRHLIADLSGVSAAALREESFLMNVFAQALQDAGCQIVTQASHKFPGQASGVTGFFLLSESHAAFHTYPEHAFIALDIFVCGQIEPGSILAAIESQLRPERTVSRVELRSQQVQLRAL